MITDIPSANTAIQFATGTDFATMDEAVRDKLIAINASPIAPEAITQFVEFAYANPEELSEDMKLVAADVCDYAAGQSWYGLGVDQRGSKIAASLRGEVVEDAPAPQANMIVNAPVPEITPPPVPPLPQPPEPSDDPTMN